ncbi:MAG TPA: hypothetical protein DEP00_06240 [Lachnospiraceae bacterium]|nr:hypothetical protein [Lachnospiraceae bacterium]
METVYFITYLDKHFAIAENGWFHSIDTVPKGKVTAAEALMNIPWTKIRPTVAHSIISHSQPYIDAYAVVSDAVFPIYTPEEVNYTVACDATGKIILSMKNGYEYIANYFDLLPKDLKKLLEHTSIDAITLNHIIGQSQNYVPER